MLANDLRERLALWALGAVVVLSALLGGGVHTPVLLVSSLVSCAAALLLRDTLKLSALAWLWLGLCAVTLLQVVPWPAAVASVLSPRTTEVWTRTHSLWGEPLGFARGWIPLSLAPGASLVEALKLATYAAVTAVAGALARRQGPWQLARLVVLAATSAAVVTILTWLFGFETLFGVYRPRFAERPLPIMNPNSLAGYLNLGTFCALGLLLRERRPGWLLALASAAVLNLATVLILASRGAVATLLGGFALGAWVFVRSEHPSLRSAWRRAGIVAGIAVAAIGLFALGAAPHTWRDLGSRSLFKLELFQRVLALIGDHPWLGVGRGAFETAFVPYQPQGLYTANLVFSHPENVLLQWASEWGTPVAFVAILVAGLSLRSRSLVSKGLPTTAVLIGVGVLLTQNLFDLGSEIPALMIGVCVVWGGWFSVDAVEPRSSARDWKARDRKGSALAIGICVALIGAVLWRQPMRIVEAREQLYRDRTELTGTQRGAYLQRLRRAMHEYPGDAYLIVLAAHAAREQNPAQALRWANWALERDPNHGPAHLLVAEQLWSAGAHRQALLGLRLAVSSWPSLLEPTAQRIRAWTQDANSSQPVIDLLREQCPQLGDPVSCWRTLVAAEQQPEGAPP